MNGDAAVEVPAGTSAGHGPPVPALLFPLVIVMLLALVVLKIRAARSGRPSREAEPSRPAVAGRPTRELPADPAAALAVLKAVKGGDTDA